MTANDVVRAQLARQLAEALDLMRRLLAITDRVRFGLTLWPEETATIERARRFVAAQAN